MSPESAPFVPSKRVLFTPLPDGSGVLLDLDTKFYFTLNATSVFVWQTLVELGQATAAALGARVAAEFEVSEAQATENCAALLAQLVRDGLVKHP